MIRAIYPGSFDPVTNGHIDIIERASKLCDELIVAVSTNIKKSPLFTTEERLDMLKKACQHLPNVTIDGFVDLTVSYAASKKAQAIIRGLRALSDVEFELEMAIMNKRLDTRIETIFMSANAEYSYLSSSIVKEISSFGGSVQGLVPPIVEEYLANKFLVARGPRQTGE
jgi:pantetheine-phosphate adenylyltransferase